MKRPAIPAQVRVLELGSYYHDRGIIVVAGTKTAILAWIKENYPKHKRRIAEVDTGELYFENEDEQTWLRSQRDDFCPLVLQTGKEVPKKK